jgi:hypothetical protein
MIKRIRIKSCYRYHCDACDWEGSVFLSSALAIWQGSVHCAEAGCLFSDCQVDIHHLTDTEMEEYERAKAFAIEVIAELKLGEIDQAKLEAAFVKFASGTAIAGSFLGT